MGAVIIVNIIVDIIEAELGSTLYGGLTQATQTFFTSFDIIVTCVYTIELLVSSCVCCCL
jgi:hypothetical protein